MKMAKRICPIRQYARQFARFAILPLALSWLVQPCVSSGQAATSEPDKITDAIEHVKEGHFYPSHIEQIAEAHAVQAIPALKDRFVLSQEEDEKGKIAAALVRLGEKDDTYWSYLVAQATAAINSDLPFPTAFDSQGRQIPGQVSPEFTAWIKAHNVAPEVASQDAVFGLPGKLVLLGETGDARGVPLLRQALQSHNPMIVIMGAKGLAAAQDKDSIPLIIEACKRSPGTVAIAESLVYFDDPRAQSAADTNLPRDFAKAIRERAAKGRNPFY